jgi:hypothetical protein
VKRFLVSSLALAAICLHGMQAARAGEHNPHRLAAKKAVAIKVAPADEYFGRLKMSILGIANTIKDQSLAYDRRPDQLQAELHAVSFAEDAIRDWEHKYPQDPWIAKSLFALERFYNKIPTDECRADAMATMRWLVRDFPHTWYGRTGKEEIAEGKVGTTLTETGETAAKSQ